MRALKGWLAALHVSVSCAALASGPGELRFYDVCINGSCSGPARVLATDEDHWLIDMATLDAAGISSDGWPRTPSEGQNYVDLAAVFPDATLAFDDATQTLDVTLPASAWPEQTLRRSSNIYRPVTTPSQLSSVYANYSLQIGEHREAAVYGEAGWVHGPWLLRSSFADGAGREIRRGLTSLELDQPERNRRFILGDQDTSILDPYASGARLGGLGVVRAYELTPGFVTFPGADVRGFLQAPGSVDVFANGQLIARQDIQAGPFSLRDLALPPGQNDLRLVVHDPFAGTYEISSSAYMSPRLLRDGLHEFQDRIGRVSARETANQPQYGDWLLSLNHRYGVSDWLTAGGRYEQFENRRNAGASVDIRPGIGTLSIATAYSRDDASSGAAWRLGYSLQRRSVSLAFGAAGQAPGYRHILADNETEFVAARESRFISVSSAVTRRVQATAQFQSQRRFDGAAARSVGLILAWRVGTQVGATLNLNRRTGDFGAGDNAYLRIYASVGRASVSAGASSFGDAAGYQLGVRRSPPADRGVGYSADIEERGETTAARAALDLVAPFGRTHVAGSAMHGEGSVDVYHSAGVLWAQGEVFATQPGSQGYAIVRTGRAGVPVLRENLRVAVTKRDGVALVPGLLPYESNLVSIDADRLDADVLIDKESSYVSVPRNGVAVVAFDVREVRSVQAFLVANDGGEQRRLSYGDATVENLDSRSMIGRDGQVYFEALPQGRHVISAASGGIVYVCVLEMPKQAGMAWLGEVPCAPQ